MRTLLLLSFLIASDVSGFAQTPATPGPRPVPQPGPAAPGTPKPAAPAQPAARRAQPPANTRSGMTITVTDPRGVTIEGVQVQVSGPTERSGETNPSGQLNFPGLQAGTYRLRFSGDSVITFEREVTVRPGQVSDIDVTLNPALPPPDAPASPAAAAATPAAPAAPAASAAAPVVGPSGQPQTLSVPDLLEKDFIGTQPRRETLLSCSGNTRTTMIQLNMPMPDRLYETADAAYYVIGGDGTVRIAGKETKLTTNEFVSVPRRTLHAFMRSGRRPLILLAMLSGEPCEQAK